GAPVSVGDLGALAGFGVGGPALDAAGDDGFFVGRDGRGCRGARKRSLQLQVEAAAGEALLLGPLARPARRGVLVLVLVFVPDFVHVLVLVFGIGFVHVLVFVQVF